MINTAACVPLASSRSRRSRRTCTGGGQRDGAYFLPLPFGERAGERGRNGGLTERVLFRRHLRGIDSLSERIITPPLPYPLPKEKRELRTPV